LYAFDGASPGSLISDPVELGSPEPYVESFGSRVRDELLAVEQFSCLAEAKVLVEDWRADYNEHRPHSALGIKSPARFARAWRAQHEPLAASLRSPICRGNLVWLVAVGWVVVWLPNCPCPYRGSR
jgi:hypothetical protein